MLKRRCERTLPGRIAKELLTEGNFGIDDRSFRVFLVLHLSPAMAEVRPGSPTTSRTSSWFGLAPHVRTRQVVASLSTAAFSISFLVFIAAATPFVLSELLNVPSGRTGDITGSLIVADELTSLALYLPIGGMCDQRGVGIVAASGYMIVTIALVLYVQCTAVWELVLVRMLFAVSFFSPLAEPVWGLDELIRLYRYRLEQRPSSQRSVPSSRA